MFELENYINVPSLIDLLDINEAKQYKLIKEFEQKKISLEKFDNEINKLIKERKQILECN